MKCGTFLLLIFLVNVTGCLQIVSNIQLNQRSGSSSTSSISSSNTGTSEEVINIPTTPWLKQMGAVTVHTGAAGGDNSGNDWCYDIAVDKWGNVICADRTPGEMGDDNVGGDLDIVIIKFDADGDLQWVTQLGDNAGAPVINSSGDDHCESVAVDNEGNVYCSGATTGNLGETNGGGGNEDAFVLKLNSDGELQWIRQLGTTSTPIGGSSNVESCHSVTVDSSQNVYCAGYTSGKVDEANAGSYDVFVMKLSSDGSVDWVTQFGGTTVAPAPGGDNSGWDRCLSVAVDGSGNVYCAGETSAGFGEGYSGGGFDAFVLKLDSSGDLVWITQMGDSTFFPGGDNLGDDVCNGLDVDSYGNVYCGGWTNGDFAEGNEAGDDAMVFKLTSSGTLDWGVQFGDTTAVPGGDKTQNEECESVKVDNFGNVYCAGFTEGALGEANGGGANEDGFVMKLDSSGNLLELRQLGSVTTVPGTNTASSDFFLLKLNSDLELNP